MKEENEQQLIDNEISIKNIEAERLLFEKYKEELEKNRNTTLNHKKDLDIELDVLNKLKIHEENETRILQENTNIINKKINEITNNKITSDTNKIITADEKEKYKAFPELSNIIKQFNKYISDKQFTTEQNDGDPDDPQYQEYVFNKNINIKKFFIDFNTQYTNYIRNVYFKVINPITSNLIYNGEYNIYDVAAAKKFIENNEELEIIFDDLCNFYDELRNANPIILSPSGVDELFKRPLTISMMNQSLFTETNYNIRF